MNLSMKLTDGRAWYKQVISGCFLTIAALFYLFLGSMVLLLGYIILSEGWALKLIGLICLGVFAFVVLALTADWSFSKGEG